MSPDARETLEALAALWRRERKTTRDRFLAERSELPLKERVKRGIALRDLSVLDSGPAPGGLTLVWIQPERRELLLRLRVGVGDPVLLWQEAPTHPDATRATVARRRRDRLGVMVRGDLPDAFEWKPFHLDREEPQETFDRGDRALALFLGAPNGSDAGRLRGVLYGGAAPAFDPDPAWEPLDPDLNEPQRAAVTRALAARDLALIHGPPGTGKTRTLVEVICQTVERERRVLATAASNAAVDNLAERLVAAGIDVVRLGHPARVAPALEEHILSALVEASETTALARSWISEAHERKRRLFKRWAKRSITWDERKEEQREINRLFRDARVQIEGTQRAILQGTPVVCATAAGADSDLLAGATFDLVVVDEATQSPDPMTLCALSRGPRAVLAGDPHQLPPTVIDRKAEREGLGTTAFERLATSASKDEVLRLLIVQHRMHETIMAFPSESMYEGRLEAAPAVRTHLLEDLEGVAPDPLRPGPLVFLDTAGKGWDDERSDDDPSTRNPSQAERVAREVRRLLSRGMPPADVAVIAPYDAQVRLLREALRAELDRGLEVRTVDGFQGREKEAVLVDLVRSNDRGEIGFLADTRRMNVALTRARRFLLVVGDSATIGGHRYYAGFLEAVEALGEYVSAWADEGEEL